MTKLFRPRPLIGLPHILFNRQILEVPRDMQSTNQWVLKGDYMVHLKANGAIEIEGFNLFLESGKLRLLDMFFPLGNVIPITFGVGFLPSLLGRKVLFLIRRLPSLGSLIVSGGAFRIRVTTSLFNGASGNSVFLLPIEGVDIPTGKASGVAGLPPSNMPMWARLSCIIGFKASGQGVFSGYDFVHWLRVYYFKLTANGACSPHGSGARYARERELA